MFKTTIRNFIFKNFVSNVLFLGNNMITGQNGYDFTKNIDFSSISSILMQSSEAIIQYFKQKAFQYILFHLRIFMRIVH